MKNTFVVASDEKYSCLIVHNDMSNENYIIDTRGELYQLPRLSPNLFLGPAQYSFVFERQKGCFCIKDYQGVSLWRIRAVSKEQTQQYIAETAPDKSLTINPEFNRFFRKLFSKRRNEKYLCLACGVSKQGKIIEWLIKCGLPYELIPNIFLDDDTINIRIKIDQNSCKRSDVLYLASKYESNYSIFNIPIIEYLAALNISYDERHKYNLLLPTLSDSKLKMCDCIINTLKAMFGLKTNSQIFSRVFEPILQLFYQGVDYSKNDTFSYILVPTEDFEIEPQINPFASKEALQKYESALLAQMKENGIAISKWASEVEMFTIIHNKYPDAIYQYRSSWLGKQSIDVFVPSLNIGFEYQGIQHFQPVEHFGGEEAFKETQARDTRKKVRCRSHGIRLIYWNYNEPVTKIMLDKKLKT